MMVLKKLLIASLLSPYVQQDFTKAERMKKMIQDLAAGKSYELGPTSVSALKVLCLKVIFIIIFVL